MNSYDTKNVDRFLQWRTRRKANMGILFSAHLLLSLIGLDIGYAQQVGATISIGSLGRRIPKPTTIAPGQLITIFFSDSSLPVFPSPPAERLQAGEDAKLTMAGYSATLTLNRVSMPILSARSFQLCGVRPGFAAGCSQQIALTMQVPYKSNGLSGEQLITGDRLSVGKMGSPGDGIQVQTVSDKIEILTDCDAIFLPEVDSAPSYTCKPKIIHGDGSIVSANRPAKPGEILSMFATGLGVLEKDVVAGKVVTEAIPTKQPIKVDFRFETNSLGFRPGSLAQNVQWAGLVPGYIGLYQVNVKVPEVVSGTPPCTQPEPRFEGFADISSNLVISLAGLASFDSAAICVAVD